jgi:hypothetical protein
LAERRLSYCDARNLASKYRGDLGGHVAAIVLPQDREEPVSCCGAQQAAQLLVGQRCAFDPLQSSLLGCPGERGDVAADQPAPNRVIE